MEDILHWTKLQFQEFLSGTVDTMLKLDTNKAYQQICFDDL